ncbi:hypothetical protein L228DRAFT_24910 [Xylona heveae TC161]|uniref:tRNA-splicing endonuclease subunit Sen2 n=1 Tax=Xylona heveae (strain CBS 132557 / TC161) TaxID=1328760 RepID=A0A165AC68_XYLHT|nr:hypothetical protein L228DRAFT_24910 [Xylona heveae TC161]KZF20240.1 hypothetical protein L228DRAFT_24910 [Xylona heveae TC161]
MPSAVFADSLPPQAVGDQKPAPRPPRTPRPNYARIHALPIPVKTYPLPTFVPNNPISLFHLAYTFFAHLLSAPPSHPQPCFEAYFSNETRSVHVADPATVRALWEQGFFGKGSLSRSEPTWMDREKRRRGLLAVETSEEVTQKRRAERRAFKKERARKEREAIEEKLREEGKLVNVQDGEEVHKPDVETQSHEGEPTEGGAVNGPVDALPAPEKAGFGEAGDAKKSVRFSESELHPRPLKNDASAARPTIGDDEPIVDQEHLQLTLEEALFLTYGLGTLRVRDEATGQLISTSSLFTMCRQHSYFPPKAIADLQPDDPFLISYVVYHHFRSLGWVVRSGIKFAVDYLLYNRGPVFSHAEFALIVLPSYSHPYWSEPSRKSQTVAKESKQWWWLHCVNRVQSQVRKNLVLVYVDIPPPSSLADLSGTVNITEALQCYRIREFSLKRWIPNRSRD